MGLYGTGPNIPHRLALLRSVFKKSLNLSYFVIAENQIWVYNTVFGKIA